jgi:hypothetical protein
VIKYVVRKNGGKKTSGDFTLMITCVTASGGNSFAGSESGVTKTFLSVRSYVSEASVLRTHRKAKAQRKRRWMATRAAPG